MTRAGATVALAVVAIAGTARGDIWQDAIDGAAPTLAAKRRKSAAAVFDGDGYLATALDHTTVDEVRRMFDRALESYRAAIAADPDSAEPHQRIASALHELRVTECDTSVLCMAHEFSRSPLRPAAREIAEQIVHHWHELARLAPLDPRTLGNLFPCAILHTKLASDNTPESRRHLELAAADYAAYLDRAEDLPRFGAITPALGNLAETYMMLGRLDEAIETYRRAHATGEYDISVTYGLAVALDRDEQGTLARRLIADAGDHRLAEFKRNLTTGQTFYVPDGEKYYYLALVSESLGLAQQAIAEYDRFIRSGAHPAFQPRAKANRAALAAKVHR